MDMPVFGRYAKFYDKIYTLRDYKKEANFVYKWAGKPKIIIDLGAGTGRHHKYWKCFTVGIDQSEEMLKYCKPSKKRLYLLGNIEKLHRPLIFAPCFTALFNVVGYCNLGKIILRLRQKKGDTFIFDCWDKEKVKKEGFRINIKEFSWGQIVVEPIYEDTQCKIHITVITKSKSFSEYHYVKPYGEKEISELCYIFGYKYERKDTKNWTTYYKLTKI